MTARESRAQSLVFVLKVEVMRVTIEEKQNFLQEYRNHVRNIARIQSEIDEIRDMEMSVSVQQSDGMPHAHNITDLSSYIIRLEKHIEFLKREKKCRIEAFERIMPCIDAVEDKSERDVLFYLYIKDMNWYDIGEKVGYSPRHCQRIHGLALEHFEVVKDVALVVPKDDIM